MPHVVLVDITIARAIPEARLRNITMWGAGGHQMQEIELLLFEDSIILFKHCHPVILPDLHQGALVMELSIVTLRNLEQLVVVDGHPKQMVIGCVVVQVYFELFVAPFVSQQVHDLLRGAAAPDWVWWLRKDRPTAFELIT